MSLMEYGYVWWMDTSVRVTEPKLEPVLRIAESEGIVFSVNSDPKNILGITKQTDLQTFDYLHEDPCLYRDYSESSATTLIVKSNPVTYTLVKAWAICALNKDCISPPGTKYKKVCNLTEQTDGRCHRFDQSVLSILTSRLFHERIRSGTHKNVLNTVIEVLRGQVTHYFERCYLILKCLA